MLIGQAKRDYQRDYMRRRRKRLKGITVRPKKRLDLVRPTTGLLGTQVLGMDPTELADDVFAKFAGPLTKERQTSRKGFNK